jgi:hypothetical protein
VPLRPSRAIRRTGSGPSHRPHRSRRRRYRE